MTESLKLLLLTSLALIAFAANSILCRLALQPANIDPASFTSIRLISGALTLAIILMFRSGKPSLNLVEIFFTKRSRDWFGAISLFGYAVFFSFSYTLLDTASGALILFATVQIVLLASQLFQGYRFNSREIIGILLAFAGFTALLLPNASRPDLAGLSMMILAGIAWAGYTLVGKYSNQPTLNTAENFIRSVPITLVVWIIFNQQISINGLGMLWAILSGVFASAIGYSLWYFAVKRISITLAAISQLLVPILAAIGGIMLVNESISMQFIASASLILVGIALVSLSKK